MQAHNLPSFITEKYIVSELIYTSDRTETYKLYDRNDSNDSENKAYLLKVRCKEEKTTVDAEENALKKLEEQQIDAPRFVERVDDSDKCYLIRDYVEGRTLQEYAQMRGDMTEREIIGIGVTILSKLMTLHSLSDPLIHRDIKPKNILITENELYSVGSDKNTGIFNPLVNDIILIDFDTTRVYKEDKTSDTVYLGTVETAAPEQYGFDQSDVRTDIYGVAKTLIYLATGSYDPEELKYYNYSKKLKELLIISTSLDKSLRPSDAQDMTRRLLSVLRSDNHKKLIRGIDIYDGRYTEKRRILVTKPRKILYGGLFFAGFVAAFVMIFFLGEITGRKGAMEATDSMADGAPSPTHRPDERVDFEGSESMKTAICTSLGIDEKDADKLTYKDLEPIETLACIGNKSYSDLYTFNYTDSEETLVYFRDSYAETERALVEQGDIKSAEILRYMPNLNKLYLVHQKIEDISPIADLRLRDLALVDCPISDLSPLNNHVRLEQLVLGKINCDDDSFLEKMPKLGFLQLVDMTVPTLKYIENLGLGELCLDKTFVSDESYDVISRMKFLNSLELNSMSEKQISLIGGSPTVLKLTLQWVNLPDGLQAIGSFPALRDLKIATVTLDSLEGLDKLAPRYLYPPETKDTSWIKNSTFVKEMEITQMKLKDYTILQDSSLEYVYATKEQQKEMRKQIKKPSFEIRDV